MVFLEEEKKTAFMTCIEVALMRRGNSHYNSVRAKLSAQYNCDILDCINHPEYLKSVLKEVYHNEYMSILDDISAESDRIDNMDRFKADFFKVLEN